MGATFAEPEGASNGKFGRSARPGAASPADAAHRALGLLEARLADVVAVLLAQHDLAQARSEFGIARVAAQERLEVVLVQAEKAGADFPVGRQAEPIAMAAKRLRDGGDDTDLAAPIAATGVDHISIGRLTKDVKAVDYSMRVLGPA